MLIPYYPAISPLLLKLKHVSTRCFPKGVHSDVSQHLQAWNNSSVYQQYSGWWVVVYSYTRVLLNEENVNYNNPPQNG